MCTPMLLAPIPYGPSPPATAPWHEAHPPCVTLVRALSLAEAPVHLSGGREVTAAVAQRCHTDEAAGGEAALLVPQAPSVIIAGAGTRRELRLRRGLGADAGVGWGVGTPEWEARGTAPFPAAGNPPGPQLRLLCLR